MEGQLVAVEWMDWTSVIVGFRQLQALTLLRNQLPAHSTTTLCLAPTLRLQQVVYSIHVSSLIQSLECESNLLG